MASLRTILFGYTVENGQMRIQPEEAKAVRDMFLRYISGDTLQMIADSLTERRIIYYKEQSIWNKNAVNRIIENRKYIGDGEYPAIITEEIFHVANEKKPKRGGKTAELSPIVAHLKSISICGKCGSRYRRINTWGSREKWMCANGCRCPIYIDDKVLEEAVLRAVNEAARDPDVLNNEAHSKYAQAIEVIKEENELLRILDQSKIDFKVAAKSVLRSAELAFFHCNYDRGAATEVLRQALSAKGEQQALTVEMLKKYIRNVKIYSDGRIATVFCNNAEVTDQAHRNSEGKKEDDNGTAA